MHNYPPIDDVVHHFVELSRRFSHPPTSKGSFRAIYQSRQVDLYHLAQVITARVFPDVQSNLDQCRRVIMDELTKGPCHSSVIGLIPRNVPSRFVRWNEYQITPEISFDPSVTGRVASGVNVKRLKQCLFEQFKAIQFVMQEHIKTCQTCRPRRLQSI